ncbi:MAG TPA: hypothetical protein VGR85_15620 [Candidatus Limnocylindria bacterium]|jgi:hypothetical protein|nr:hypothetical protein [Candidatus Limnocylindria bacterium]
MRCVLCGALRDREQLRELYTRDFRGQQIVVLICIDGTACIERATLSPTERHALEELEEVVDRMRA